MIACKKCGIENRFEIKPGKGPHAGRLDCADCGAFIKWVSKNFLAVLIEEQNEEKKSNETTGTNTPPSGK